jgi:hypothetical protein
MIRNGRRHGHPRLRNDGGGAKDFIHRRRGTIFRSGPPSWQTKFFNVVVKECSSQRSRCSK